MLVCGPTHNHCHQTLSKPTRDLEISSTAVRVTFRSTAISAQTNDISKSRVRRIRETGVALVNAGGNVTAVFALGRGHGGQEPDEDSNGTGEHHHGEGERSGWAAFWLLVVLNNRDDSEL